MAAITNKKQKYLRNLQDYRVAMGILNDALSGLGPNFKYHKFEDIFDGFSEAWEFSYSSRLFAALISLAIERVPGVDSNEVERSFKLTQGDISYQLPKA